jgi:hypothetical protein
MWDSWVGSNFKSKRTLLLLESCYDWNNENGEVQRPKPNHPQNIVNWAIEEHLSDSSPTMRRLTRAICGCKDPSREQKFNSWQQYALTNYIPVSVGYGPIRPNTLMWNQAEKNWAAVVNQVNPRTIIVLGMELWNRMPRTTYRDELLIST